MRNSVDMAVNLMGGLDIMCCNGACGQCLLNLGWRRIGAIAVSLAARFQRQDMIEALVGWGGSLYGEHGFYVWRCFGVGSIVSECE